MFMLSSVLCYVFIYLSYNGVNLYTNRIVYLLADLIICFLRGGCGSSCLYCVSVQSRDLEFVFVL